MASREKTALRLQKVQQRLNKPRYPANARHRRMLKLDAQAEALSKAESSLWATMYGRGFKPGRDNEVAAFADDFVLLNGWVRQRAAVRVVIARLEQRTNSTLEEVQHLFRLVNRGRMTSSF